MIVAFALGLTRDFYAGGVTGMNAFSLTLMAFLLIAAEDYLMTNNWRGQCVVVLVGSLMYGTIFLLLKMVIGYEVGTPLHIVTKMAWTAMYTSALGPIMFTLTRKPPSLPYLRLKLKYDSERSTLSQTEV
jgi:rod shape-determining protein MreD